MAGKRCICGKSSRLPLCDGSHESEAWACRASTPARARWGFAAAASNVNLAERLAAELGGVVVAGNDTEVDELVVLTDGTDLDRVLEASERVRTERRRALGIGIDASLLSQALSGWTVTAITEEGVGAWDAVREAVTGSPAVAASKPLASAFLSHAVADEGLLLDPVAYLRRRFEADIFVCADSITSGTHWHDHIVGELGARDLFVLVVSEASTASGFCAFETGYAAALAKHIALVSLDGSRPPSFVQHLHMIDLARVRRAKPWLDQGAAFTNALLSIIS